MINFSMGIVNLRRYFILVTKKPLLCFTSDRSPDHVSRHSENFRHERMIKLINGKYLVGARQRQSDRETTFLVVLKNAGNRALVSAPPERGKVRKVSSLVPNARLDLANICIQRAVQILTLIDGRNRAAR